MTPVFAHGDLRLYLLRILADGPRHGYDIMQALTERTGGAYSPSAGTIYPRLAKLEEEGLVTKTVDGRKTVYELTPAGQAEVDARADEVEGIESGLADSVRRVANDVRTSVEEAMRALRDEFATAAREEAATATAEQQTARSQSRAELQRADAAINEFRGRVRMDLRAHVARGGELDAGVIDDLVASLDAAARDITRALSN